ncbi:MAG: cyclic nucleotide-binding domain-containing protein, partial [Chloroflexi bacterium]|nr:cyclic nucleotide-binding domain-containing protein [Chloroflexota bacterium]
KLLFADLSPRIQHQLEKGAILDADSDVALNFSDIDYALEWCENELLNQEDITSIRIPSIKAQLSESFQPAVKLDRFLAYLEEQIIDENAPLIVKGEPSFGIFFIERGQVTVQIELESGETARLRTMGSGTVVGEIGTYLDKPASATVVTDMPCIIYFLSTESLKKMEQDEPAIAAAFHKFMVELISQRLVNSNTTLQALLE